MPFEILDQILTAQDDLQRKVTHVVFMGMGEPLLNTDSVLRSLQLLREAFVSARSITVSTVGIPGQMERLAQSAPQTTLAISLHAPNQALREELVPSARAFPLPALLADAARYFALTHRRVTFEYCLLSGVNDTPEHAVELAQLLRTCGFPHHVNLLPWNPIADAPYRRPDRQSVLRFQNALLRDGVSVTVRVTRGLDSNAACGQLRNDSIKRRSSSSGGVCEKT